MAASTKIAAYRPPVCGQSGNLPPPLAPPGRPGGRRRRDHDGCPDRISFRLHCATNFTIFGPAVSTILLIGFDHPDSAHLLDQMRQLCGSRHDFVDAAGGETGASADAAIVWRHSLGDDAALALTAAAGPGVPALVLAQDFVPGQIDFNAAHIELALPPFQPSEVLTRLDILFSRARGAGAGDTIRHGDLVIDQVRYEVTLAGKKIDLTYKEYELLRYMASRPGRVFSRESLLRAVWDYDYFGGTRTVDVHVRRLRSKMDSARHQFIETVWNVGYRFRPADGRGGG